MLENAGDYLAVLSMIAVLIVFLGVVLYLINLKVIEKNVKEEVKYYNYDKNLLLKQKSEKDENKQISH